MLLGALVALVLTVAAPSEQTLVFYNARLALRDGKPTDALKLWLLHNALLDQGMAAANTPDFRSVVWTALGDRGLCADGLPADEDGAGLWPLALHNGMLHAVARGDPPSVPNPYDAFEAGLQQRYVTLSDVLSVPELKSVSFFPTACYAAMGLLLKEGQLPWSDLHDRLISGPILRKLLVESLATLRRAKVQSVAPIEARIFHLDLALAELMARRAREQGLEAKVKARIAGASREGAQEAQAAAARWRPGSPQERFLKRTLQWPASDWMLLSRKERLFLFAQAKPFFEGPDARRAFVTRTLDALLERRAGAEVTAWLGELTESDAPGLIDAFTSGDRGLKLLSLDADTGFKDRAVIALHRGVRFLASGARQDALRSFAFALGHADEGHDGSEVASLARRWLAYVLAQYRTDDEVLSTLRALVPLTDYNAVIEELVWRAALRADAASFDRVTKTSRRGSSFDALVRRLDPLAHGDAGAFLTKLRDESKDEPYSTLRFVKLFLEKLELEDADVRRANVPTLANVLEVLRGIVKASGDRGSNARNAQALMDRVQAVLDGLETLDQSTAGRARSLGPSHETFAGNIRLAPSDPLPWPFKPPEVEAPPAFTPLLLTPVEWRDAKGQVVFGWRVTSDDAS